MRPVETALNILEALGRLQPAGVSELARELDLPKSTVQRALRALAETGWIETVSDEKGAWSLSLRAGLAVGPSDFATRHLRAAAIPVMEELRRRTSESVYLAVRDGFRMALVERLDGINPVTHAWPLWRPGPMHPSSLGRAILAVMPDEELDEYLSRPLAKVSAQTITDPDLLRAELRRSRERGFALAYRSNWPNENGVGAAIRNSRGEPFAAISVSAPVERVDESACEAMGDLLADAARRISLGLQRR
ncbi:IclR family transcriptional regulator [Caulobacter segnis]|uniref:IclR family transcriptional regulator n=1 Tax=Caulobacter segnis TaxID=88688 RepID=UPI0024106C9F|nr:IclR family transcriptional regulator [Caulobacter segnis]MDG2522560.1 IclR family transcriptional regulator [Caulobacter segnis]